MSIINRILRKIVMPELKEEVNNRKLEKINQELKTTNIRLDQLEKELGKALSGYKVMLLKNNPDILAEMIGGESVEAVDRSLEAARQLTGRIRQNMEQKITSERIPGGAPVRTPPNIDNLNSYEKILYGLEGK